tara:strand:+ start:234 stop:1199 length:966 start_codon:yes stop_codon:yes gene_type:complete
LKSARLVSRRNIQFNDISEPGPLSKNEVLIEIQAMSICGSDILLEYDAELSEEHYPFIHGAPMHECAGVVIDSKSSKYKNGDRVIVFPENVNGMQERIISTPSRLIKLPTWGSLDDWVMCQPMGTALFSTKKWGNPINKNIAIIGQGPIGLTFTQIAEKQGALNVVGIDLIKYRCIKSKEFGSTDFIHSEKENILEKSLEITNGELFDTVVDASGDPTGLNTAINIAKDEGQIVSFSLVHPDNVEFNHRQWMTKNLQLNATVVAATSKPIQEIKEVVNLASRGWLEPSKLRSHNMKFDQIKEAFEIYRQKKDNVIKIAISF